MRIVVGRVLGNKQKKKQNKITKFKRFKRCCVPGYFGDWRLMEENCKIKLAMARRQTQSQFNLVTKDAYL